MISGRELYSYWLVVISGRELYSYWLVWEGAVQLLVGDLISGRELYSYWLGEL